MFMSQSCKRHRKNNEMIITSTTWFIFEIPEVGVKSHDVSYVPEVECLVIFCWIFSGK